MVHAALAELKKKSLLRFFWEKDKFQEEKNLIVSAIVGDICKHLIVNMSNNTQK